MNKYHILSFVIFALFITLGASMPSAQQGDEPHFKNLKVLPKDITKQQLDSVMGHFSVSLGVKCNFCHAADADTSKHHLDFASDAKQEKDIARGMYNMTASINTNFFNWMNSTRTDTIHSVVCYTCHRGSKDPDAKMFISYIDSTIQESHKNRGK